MEKKLIPLYQPSLAGNEERYITECLNDNWISSKGKFVGQFEEEFAAYLKVAHATTVSNGTCAIHLALHTLGIGKGDEVIVPTLTYIATVNPILYVGATPVFVDSEPKTWNMDVSLIEQKITPRTKAIVAMHLYGSVCEMHEIQALCKKHNLLLIEDAAEAFGSKFRGRYAGTFGDIATFSFFGNKTITTGEGGMLVSNDEETIKRAAHLKSQAVSPSREYWHDEIGFNFRMTNICAAIGVAQLEQANTIIEAKIKIASCYKEELKGLPIVFQDEASDSVNNYWLVSVLVEKISTINVIRKALNNAGVETRPFFSPLHTLPMYKSDKGFPISEDIYARGISLPSFPTLTREKIKYVCTEIRKAYEITLNI